MMSHYLPLSISNRTAATIQLQHELFASPSTGYTDIIDPYQTTPTKAIKTDLKFAKLETCIFIDLEQPKRINIQLVKRMNSNNRFDHYNTIRNISTTPTNDIETQKKSQKDPVKSKLIGSKIKKTLFSNPNGNRKFLRLKVDYFLNSQPYFLKDEAENLDEQDQVAFGSLSESESRREEEHSAEASDNQLIHSNSENRVNKKIRIPQFEIFQSISDDGSVLIMVLHKRNFTNWMSQLPDSLSISELTIPGSHQSCALHGWPIAQCQSRSLSRQLQDGIRFLDIRLALPTAAKASTSKRKSRKIEDEEPDRLVAYHGIQSQVIKFEEILKILNDFLISQPTETIIISIKKENHSDPELFKNTLRNELIHFYQSEENFHNHWWLKSFLPESLEQVRGKLILFSRKLFHSENDEDFGIRFPTWPDNSTEIWETSIANTHVAVQDWYDIGSFLSISKKSSLACVSLCGALHEPLRSSSSPIPTSRPKSPNATNELNEADQPAKKEQKNLENVHISDENQSSRPETNENGKPKTWVITFLSASSLILGFPTICSRGLGHSKIGFEIEGINSRVARWLASRRNQHMDASSSSIKGVVCLMDFYQSPKEALISLLVDCNFPS